MVNTSIMQLFTRTMPFFITRLLVYGIFGLAALVFLGVMIGIGFLLAKLFGENASLFIIIMVFSFITIYGALRMVERYVLYIVKVGHVSVVTELLHTGKIPEGKGQVAYGKEQVTKNFGTANMAFVLDNMVHATVRQVQRWIIRVRNMFSFLPGSQNIIGIINAIMGVALNYIDESIVSYIFVKQKEGETQSVWKSAADGVVLYAQSWKGIMKTAAIAVICIWIFNIILFIGFSLLFIFISTLFSAGDTDKGFLFGAIAVVAAYVVTTVLKRALIDPVVTIAMVRAYQISIRNLTPAMDLQEKLHNVSSQFRKLVKKGEAETYEPPSPSKPEYN